MSHSNDNARGSSRRAFLQSAALVGGATAAAIAPTAQAASAPLCPATGSVAWMQPDNNNGVIEAQKNGVSSPLAAGDVALEFYGHCAFKITSPRGATLLCDPWRNDPSGAWGLWYPNDFPQIRADIGLSTHAHFDHDALDRVQALMLLDRMVGEYQFADMKITGLADKHACEAPGWYKWTNAIKEFGASPCPPNNPHHMDMSMYLIETGGLRILMWGDNRHNPNPHVLSQLTDIDVLTLPVDGSQHILSYEQGDEIVARIAPKIVIPTHYLCEGVSLTLTTLQTADEWVSSQKSKKSLSSGKLILRKDEVAGMRREFMYFGANTMIG